MTSTRTKPRTAAQVVLLGRPQYFSFVMATGIVSLAMRLHHLRYVSAVLISIGLAGWTILLAANLTAAMWSRAAWMREFTDPHIACASLAFVAGTNVLGSWFALGHHDDVALAALGLGTVAWIVLGYAIAGAIVVTDTGTSRLRSVNALWFLWVVGCQSVAVNASLCAADSVRARTALTLLAVMAWSVGAASYAGVLILVVLRLLCHGVTPQELTPAYWITMGATAITVLAGSQIGRLTVASPGAAVHSFIGASSVVFWSFGSWLIPLLLAGGWWRHSGHRMPLRYEAGIWGIVFPLGMYSVASYDLGHATHITLIQDIGYDAAWIALTAWFIGTVGLVVSTSRWLRTGR
ncbi:MAG: tellurite resistance/C4-dicarboxylate transporter family protein [Acidothermus cellulolyticus]|nr:tellurite resistance/C4-dicarboxylate transporter family protein [Acidothermus cellulolyticus]